MQTTPIANGAPGAKPDDAVRARIEDAALKFEGMFIQQMLKTMRQGSGALAGENGFLRQDPDDPLLGFADQLMADQLAGQRAFGIADMLLRQLYPSAPAAPLKPAAEAAALPLQMQTNPPEPTP
ncbi:flagellar biosynthesis protein FlgJ [Pseudorhodoferax soli]|uniref:Flagellar protein FlgJ n=1 Tax=Pseudorhodoferax soli TaxID=545864 RepID=A0A368XTU9_9BURK|nr:flagellar biosynthesis protein FlgJ [Pseudorhodoferax soli]RCW70468.1 flagellar protein FlgJ [Pseudorhodoferax soli]